MSVAVGTFDGRATAGDVTITLGFEMKFMLVIGTLQTTFGSFAERNYFIAGFANGLTQFTEGYQGDWNNTAFFAPDMNRNRRNNEIISDITTGGSSQNLASIKSISSTQVVIEFGVASVAYKYEYLAVGGSGVTVAASTASCPTATGTQTIAHGLGTTPGLAILIGGQGGNSTDGIHYSLGFADGTNSGVSAFHQFGNTSGSTGTPSDNDSYQRTDKAIAVLDDVTGALLGEAGVTSLTSANIVLNWTTAPASSQTFSWVAIAGIYANVGSFNQLTSAGSSDVTGLTVTPQALLFQSFGFASNTAVVDGLGFSLGFSDGTTQLAVWNGDLDGVNLFANRRTVRYNSDAVALVAAHSTGVNTGATDALGTAGSFAGGQFTVTWSAADATARQWLYVALSDTLYTQPASLPYVIEIETIDRNPLLATFNIQDPINGIATMRADFDSAGSPVFRPSLDDEIIMTEYGSVIFGGYITAIRERGFEGPNVDSVVVEVTASDYKVAATRRYVSETITGVGSPAITLKDILTVLATYLTAYGISLDPAQVDGPTMDPVIYTDRLLKDILDELSVLTGYVWDIDVNKLFKMYAIGSVSAPFDLEETDLPAMYFGDITVEPTREQYANRVYLRFGPEGVSEITDTFFGDGVTDTFTLSAPMVNYAANRVARGYVTTDASVSPDLNETLDLLGEGATWEYDPTTNTIVNTVTPPPQGYVIQIIYPGQFPVTVTAEDAAEIAAHGLFEIVVLKPEITDLTVATALAAAELTKHTTVIRRVTYTTRERGLFPGQIQALNIPRRDLSNVEAVVVEVMSFAEPGGDVLVRQATVLEGTAIQGDWRDLYRQWL